MRNFLCDLCVSASLRFQNDAIRDTEPPPEIEMARSRSRGCDALVAFYFCGATAAVVCQLLNHAQNVRVIRAYHYDVVRVVSHG